MRGTWLNRIPLLLALVLALLISPLANAADVTVECGKKKTTNFTSISAALATLSKQGPNTIHITGNCKENVVIDKFDDLTLLGSSNASIMDGTPNNPDDDVIDIGNSRNVLVKDLTINGGAAGIACFQFSNCNLQNLTVQGAADVGVAYIQSGGQGDNVTIQNNQFRGLLLQEESTVRFGGNILAAGTTSTIQNNGNATDGGLGVDVQHNSTLLLVNATIQNHPDGDGVGVRFGSVLRVFSALTITGSGGSGISAESSVVRLQGGLGPLTITGNTGSGVSLGHLTFLQMSGSRNISGNGAPDVNCTVTTAKTRGTGGSATPNLGGGTTNCTEPAP
ncbi:MAG: hypothetical protein L0099_03840 [Acidobacteria bacterium]|nr:hypothetical protein [Acidobacteriota bacterium]